MYAFDISHIKTVECDIDIAVWKMHAAFINNKMNY